ncbi:HNH endonuclease [Halovenus rubra]|uniref:HNH endonuclease n=2 Tax=Halovenus rubra TaxID=869890 RepID=A0ACC7E313_9EURY|nr:HNH endonuclease [Halovenus rubra]
MDINERPGFEHSGTVDEQLTNCEDNQQITDPDQRRELIADGGHQTNEKKEPSYEFSLTPSVRSFLKTDRNEECELCGADGSEKGTKLHIHHRIEQQYGGTDHPDNLILLCKDCHERHHNNKRIEEKIANTSEDSADLGADRTEKETASCEESGENQKPLPPRSEPNGADSEILSLLEKKGPLSTGEIATHMDYSDPYILRQCWKLSGEQLVVSRKNNTWDLAERADKETIQIGLPDDPKGARRAGRDEVIRKMSAHGMAHTQIAEITDLSRSTIDIAVNRARALRIDTSEDDEVDFAMVATRLSALLDLIDHIQKDSAN